MGRSALHRSGALRRRRVLAAASVPDEKDLYPAQLGVFLNPDDPGWWPKPSEPASPDEWIEAAQASPVYTLIVDYQVALPLHPEYRTMPMVWYVPPLSPVVDVLETDGHEADPDHVFGAIDAMRIPVDYLAKLFTAGDVEADPRRAARLAAMRGHMRKREVLGEHDDRRSPRRSA